MSECFICNSVLEDGSAVTEVKAKGVASFWEAIKKINDGNLNLLTG